MEPEIGIGEEKMKRRIHYEGKHKRFVSEEGWEYMERIRCGGVVVILAVTDERKVIFVEQQRVPVKRKVIEFPAGLAADTQEYEGESLPDAAKREILEETGYKAEGMKLLVSGPSAAASSADILYFFKAEGLEKIGQGGGDGTEAITTHEVDLDQVETWLDEKRKEGLYIDPKIYAGLYFLERI